MTLINPARQGAWPRRRSWSPRESVGPAFVFATATATGAAAWLYLAGALPTDALLPAICILFSALAGVAAAVAWFRPHPVAGPFTYWDVAGMLILIGVCAAAAIEPDQMVRLVEGNRQP
jgi:hypothetical protein